MRLEKYVQWKSTGNPPKGLPLDSFAHDGIYFCAMLLVRGYTTFSLLVVSNITPNGPIEVAFLYGSEKHVFSLRNPLTFPGACRAGPCENPLDGLANLVPTRGNAQKVAAQHCLFCTCWDSFVPRKPGNLPSVFRLPPGLSVCRTRSGILP